MINLHAFVHSISFKTSKSFVIFLKVSFDFFFEINIVKIFGYIFDYSNTLNSTQFNICFNLITIRN